MLFGTQKLRRRFYYCNFIFVRRDDLPIQVPSIRSETNSLSINVSLLSSNMFAILKT